MCDYSLHGLPNRLAVEGEELVAHRFSTGAIGLTSPAELYGAKSLQRKSEKKSFWSVLGAAILPPVVPEPPAVCIPPGARLRLWNIPVSLQHGLGVDPEEIVTFTQTSALPNTYHDAVQFANGRRVLLQVLKEGQRVRVLSLASNEPSDPEFAKERIGSGKLASPPPQFATAEVASKESASCQDFFASTLSGGYGVATG